MAANNVETAFCLPSGINKDFMRNLLWPHYQQQQQENINQRQQQININQFTSVGVSKNKEKKTLLESFFNKVPDL